MAVSLSKREELLGLIPELQCHKCKNVPGPNGNQKNRYSCFNAAHTLCEEHKTKCPCGSKVVKSPSRVIAKLLQNLPWMCQNYQTGCRESKIDVEDLDHHQRKCIYRQVVCPNLPANYLHCQVLFKDVIDHLKICMNKDKVAIYEEKMLNGEAKKFLVKFNTKTLDLKDVKSWYPSKMTSTCGAVFFTFGFLENKTVYFWICLLGSADEAKKYSCSYSITNEIGEKFLYDSPGPVLTIDAGKDDIIASGSLLTIGLQAAHRLLNDQKQLEVVITIRNLKEEAKDSDMESGVSDGE